MVDELTYAETGAELSRVLSRHDKAYLSQVCVFWSHGVELSETHPLPSPPLILALALYGEVRGESEQGRRAVFEVIANRAIYRADGNLDWVLLQPYQFSCFNKGDYSLQRAMIADGRTLREWLMKALEYVMEWNAGGWESVLSDATIYCTPKAAIKQFAAYLDGTERAWDFNRLTRVATIGRHVFFREG